MNTPHTGVRIDSCDPQHKLRATITQAKARKPIYSRTYLTGIFPGSLCVFSQKTAKALLLEPLSCVTCTGVLFGPQLLKCQCEIRAKFS